MMRAGVLLAAACACNALGDDWPYSCGPGEDISKLQYDLSNQTFMVTGSDGRLGGEVTQAALRNGARVLAFSVTDEIAASNCAALKKVFGADAKVECFAMDQSLFANIKAAVAKLSHVDSIDVLLHLAAHGFDNITADGIVGTVEIDFVSQVLINNLLMPKLKAAPKPRVIGIGSAAGFDPLGWPAKHPAQAGISWITEKAQHPAQKGQSNYWYAFSKFVIQQYQAELAVREPTLTAFAVNPGIFRDDPSKYPSCLPYFTFTPCPMSPSQGATSTFFAAAQPGIEAHSGALFDFQTATHDKQPYWVQSGNSCIPRPLPPGWTAQDRAEWYDGVQQLVQ